MIDDMLNQVCTYWAPGGYDLYGNPSVAAPVALACRWQDKTDLIRTPDGREVVSASVVYPEYALTVQGWAALGDQTATPDPQTLPGAYQVLNVGQSPDLDDPTLVLHKAWL